MVTGLGATEIESSVAAVTVTVVDPATVLVAVMVADPTPVAVAKPLDGPLGTTARMLEFDELQATCSVMSCVVLSVNVPVATNCCVVPLANVGVAGVTAMDTSVAAVTVKVVVPLIPPDVALIVVEPVLTLAASPVASTVA